MSAEYRMREEFESEVPQKIIRGDGEWVDWMFTDEEYEIAFEGWQAAKESNRKKLEQLGLELEAERIDRICAERQLRELTDEMGAEAKLRSDCVVELEAAIKQRDFYKDAKRQAETNASDAINSLEAAKQRIAKLEEMLEKLGE